MPFPLSSPWCLHALGSISRTAPPVQAQRILLPSILVRSISQQSPPDSSSNSNHKTSSLPPLPSSLPPSTPKGSKPKFIFDFKFSSITTPETLNAVLKVRNSFSPSELALLPELEQRQHRTALHILTKASRMDPERRAEYFKEVDESFRSPDVAAQHHRSKAMEQIESGNWDEQDALTSEEFEDFLNDRREKKLGDLVGDARAKMFKNQKRQEKERRTQRTRRLEARREMKDEKEQQGKGKGDGESSEP